MGFKDDLTADLSIFFNTDEFAETIAYTPVNGTLKNIPAIVDLLEDLGDDTLGKAKLIEVIIKKDDIETPVYRDSIVIGGNEYYVSTVSEGEGYVWRLLARRDFRGNFS